MTRTGRSPRLSAHLSEPFAEIHPEDAIAVGLRDADLAELTTEFGTSLVRVLVSAKARKGALFVPMHWTAQTGPSGRINQLVAPLTDPTSGQPASKDTPVSLKRATMGWYGFVASTSEISAAAPIAYTAVAPARNGWRAELADVEVPEDWLTFAQQITGQDMGEASVLEDAATGNIRVAIREDGQIKALFFAARQPVAVSRSHVASLLGSDMPVFDALAGKAGAGRPDAGAIVCACLDVGANTLRAEIAAGANTVDALGACTGAGTNCGSCKPELAAMIAAQMKSVAAE